MTLIAERRERDVLPRFERDGYVVVDELLTSDECTALKTEALRVRGEHANPGASVHLGLAAASPLFHRLASDPRLVSVLSSILPRGVMFLSDKLVFKSGAQRFATPWHCDAMYWPGTRPKVSVWIPLEDVTAENGTLLVVRGSHRREWQHETCARPETNREFVNFVSERKWDAGDEVVCALRRGGAVFFSDRLLHASCANESGADRYVIIGTYQAPAPDEAFDVAFPARHVIQRREP
ncbi:MAG TPA: phytanoyl-CoA dioxygenase family protein [Polyangiaceae bacterium]|nr:phytanoyl-CoA dioxygenase family protein [Polyangiaceae bacterium]